MRNVIVCNMMSLDGYYSGPGGDIRVLSSPEGFDAYNAGRLHTADTVLLGRDSFDGFRGFWPSVAEDEQATDDQREISRRMTAVDKVVVSDNLTADQTAPWSDTTTIVRRADARAQIAELKRLPGKDILIFASHTLWNDLLAAGLVDELHFIVGAVVMGGGTPAFEADPKTSLRIIDVTRIGESDNTLMRYRVEHTEA